MDKVPETLSRAHEQVRNELQRADAKATTLLSLIGATLAGIVALTGREMATVVSVAVWTSTVPIAGAVIMLLSAIRPRLGSSETPGTWLHAAQNGPEALLTPREVDQLEATAEHVAVLGATAVTKFRRISAAMVSVTCGLGVLALAGLLAAIT